MFLEDNAIALVSEVSVDHSGAAQTTLYTVPPGKTFKPWFLEIEAAGDEAETDITVGKTASWDDWIGANGLYGADLQLDNLDSAGDTIVVGLWDAAPANPPTADSTLEYAAGEVIKVDVVAANGNAANVYRLFGVLKDA